MKLEQVQRIIGTSIRAKLARGGLLFVCVVLLVSVVTSVTAHAAISRRQVSSANNTTGATSLSIAMPVGTVANDVMIAVISVRGGTGVTITPPSGWQLTNASTGSADSTTALKSSTYYKVAGSGEAGPYAFNFSVSNKASGAIASYSGVNTTSPINAVASAAASSATAMVAPSITTTSPNTMLVAMFSNATGTSFSAGTGMTFGVTDASTGGNASTRTTSGLEDVSQAAAGSTGTKPMTAASGAVYVGHLVALTPAPVVSQASYRLFQNGDSTTAGTAYAAKDTAATVQQDTAFRLRLNLGANSSGGSIGTNVSYKLQYAPRGADNVCDPSFTNEAYSDVTNGSLVAFYDNPTPADGAAYVSSANDPTRTGITAVGQKYNESNPLNVGTSIPANQDGLWDIALTMPSVNKAWSQVAPGGPQRWNAIASSSDGAKLAAGASGYVFTSTDSGATWTSRSNSGTHTWTSLASSSDGAKIIGTVNGGQALRSTDSGVTWTSLAGSPSVYWYDVASSADGSKYIGATASGIYVSTDSGATWTQRSAVSAISVAMSADGAKAVASVNAGSVYTSADSGTTWTAQAGAGTRAWNAVASSSDGAKLVAVANAGYIYTSTDSGVTWTQQTAAGSRNWYSVTSSADGSKFAAGVNGGYIYNSTDSGATWTQQTNAGSRAWYAIASSDDGLKLAAGDNTSGAGALYAIALTSNPSGATYCLRAVNSDGSTLPTYTVIPSITQPVPTVSQANYRWFTNADSLTPGSALSAQDTAASIASQTPFRLRQRLAVDTAQLPVSTANYKLQYAEKVGTCDTGFSGETYADLYSGGVFSSPTSLAGSDMYTDSFSGSVAWGNASDAAVSDGLEASVASKASLGVDSYYLGAYTHFAVPTNATITGVSVSTNRRSGTSGGVIGNAVDKVISLVKNGFIYSDNKSTGQSWGNVNSWGGPTDLWGMTLTPADVNDTAFGAVFQATVSGDGVSSQGVAYVDSISITVYYTLPATPLIYSDNITPASASLISSTVNDPTNAGRPTVYQSYYENSPFTNNQAAIPAGSDGVWDFALTSTASAVGKTYCLRTVDSNSAQLSSYTQIPEITVLGTSGPTLDQQLRGGQSVVGTKAPFTW